MFRICRVPRLFATADYFRIAGRVLSLVLDSTDWILNVCVASALTSRFWIGCIPCASLRCEVPLSNLLAPSENLVRVLVFREVPGAVLRIERSCCTPFLRGPRDEIAARAPFGLWRAVRRLPTIRAVLRHRAPNRQAPSTQIKLAEVVGLRHVRQPSFGARARTAASASSSAFRTSCAS